MRAPDPAFWRGRRVLVTGHTGFKGAWLVLWLHALGAEVTGFSRPPHTDPSLFALARLDELCDSRTGDVRDPQAVAAAVEAADAEVVLHLAAQALVRRSFREPRETYEVNVMGTVNVLDAVRRHGGAKAIVSVTSDKCYENRGWEWGYRESDALGGHDPYSSSKACQELVSAAFRRSFDAPLATARAGNVIGGGDWGEDRLLPDVLRGALAGEPIAIRRPDAVRPWQHVLNPIGGYLVLAEQLATQTGVAAAFNFGPADEDVRPVRWVVEQLTALWPDPLDWRVDEGPHPHEAATLRLDSSRARQALGWGPRWDLEAGLAATVRWHLAVRDGADARATSLEQIAAYGAQ